MEQSEIKAFLYIVTATETIAPFWYLHSQKKPNKNNNTTNLLLHNLPH